MWFVFNLDLKTKQKPFSKADICTGGVGQIFANLFSS